MAIGNAVRRRRELLGWTQEQLAEESGVSMRTLFNLESGAHSVGLGNALEVAQALGTTLHRLLADAEVDLERD